MKSQRLGVNLSKQPFVFMGWEHWQHEVSEDEFKGYPNYWNTVKNVTPESKSLADLRLKNRSADVIIVGAGPSLDKDIVTLKDVAEGLNVIAVDASMKALYDNDISPDIVVTCEMDTEETHPQHGSWVDQLFDIDLSLWDKASLVAADCASIESIRKWENGKVYFYWNLDLCFDAFNAHKTSMIPDDMPALTPRSQLVGFHAIEVARYLGYRNTVLLGFDTMAYGHGDSHYKGCPHGISPDAARNMDRSRVDLDPDRAYYHAWSWFKSFFDAKFNMNIYNCSGSGRLTEEDTDCKCYASLKEYIENEHLRENALPVLPNLEG